MPYRRGYTTDRAQPPVPSGRGVAGFKNAVAPIAGDATRVFPKRTLVVPDVEDTPVTAAGEELDLGTGGAAEEGAVVEQLTGAQTEYGHFYRGDEDPEVDFGAELEPGDLWLDTTIVTGWPFVQKVRNEANDGWVFAGLVFTEDGNVRGVFRLEAGLSGGAIATMAVYNEDEVQLGVIGLASDGAINITSDVAGLNFAHIDIGVDGTISLVRGEARLRINPDESAEFTAFAGLSIPGQDLRLGTNVPTADPVIAGAIWNDSGALKISAG